QQLRQIGLTLAEELQRRPEIDPPVWSRSRPSNNNNSNNDNSNNNNNHNNHNNNNNNTNHNSPSGGSSDVVAIRQLLARKAAAVEAFEAMHAIHAALRLRGEGRLTAQEVEVYSRAAPIVGGKAWSKETVQWVLSELQGVALCRGPG
ncbi:unnamed protein product, partial [Polarella glacialis]